MPIEHVDVGKVFLYNKILAGRIPILDSVLDKYDALWIEHWHDRISVVRIRNQTIRIWFLYRYRV